MTLLAFLLTSVVHTSAYAADSFEKHPATVMSTPCKKLDFFSYHKAERAKGSLQHDNPDLTHANFAGKYLLLKNNYLFETEWFIADCETGKFLKDTVNPSFKEPQAEFKANSSLVIFTGGKKDNNASPEWQVFENGKWLKIETPITPPPTTSTLPTSSPSGVVPPPQEATSITAASYDELYSKYPASSTSTSCKKIDFNSYALAQSHEGSLKSQNPDRSQPNFAGHYYILAGDSFAEKYWLIADCDTGEIYHEELTGNLTFNSKSRLAMIQKSGKFPVLKVWLEPNHEWIQVPDPIQNKSQSVTNTMTGKDAKAFMSALNPEKLSVIRFENLICFADHCQMDQGKEKGKLIPSASFSLISTLMKSWGSSNQVMKSGKCFNTNGSPECEIEI